MKITVVDTPRAMLDIMARPLAERPAALRELIAPMCQQVPTPGDPVDLRVAASAARGDLLLDARGAA